MILRTQHLTKHFGGTVALDDVTVEFLPGSITSLIGSNGAGKSTLFNVIAGLVAPDSGEVYLGNGDKLRLNGLPTHVIAQHGVGMLFQDVRVFRKLTALENVAVGAHHQSGEHPFAAIFRRQACATREQVVLKQSHQWLDFVGLADKAHLWAENLSYGQQKLVALARLLAAEARVLLLDEPTAGIYPSKIDQLLGLIQKLADDHNRTVIMIEHNRDVVAQVSDRVYQMDRGEIVDSGPAKNVLRENDPTQLISKL